MTLVGETEAASCACFDERVAFTAAGISASGCEVEVGEVCRRCRASGSVGEGRAVTSTTTDEQSQLELLGER